MTYVAWIVITATGLPAWFADYGKAMTYAQARHGTLHGPMTHAEAEALILKHQRALLDGASPMERIPQQLP